MLLCSYSCRKDVCVQCVQADNVKQMSQGVKASMAAFWTTDRLHQLAQTLAYHFFTLTVSHVLLCMAVSATPCMISHSALLMQQSPNKHANGLIVLMIR